MKVTEILKKIFAGTAVMLTVLLPLSACKEVPYEALTGSPSDSITDNVTDNITPRLEEESAQFPTEASTAISTETPAQEPTPKPTEKPEATSGLDYSLINSKSREGHAYGVDTSVVPARIWNTEASRVAKWGGIVEGDTSRKVIYLTFNLGTEKGHTERTVEILNKHGAKATFFCLGEYVGFNPEIVKTIHESGHLIANHGDKHILTADYRTEFAVANIQDFRKTLKEKTGIEVEEKFFRPPSGYYCERDMEIAAQLGETTVFWGYAYDDYGASQNIPDNEILANLVGNITNGRIFQLHTVNEGNTDVLEAFILKAYEMGYELETLAEID